MPSDVEEWRADLKAQKLADGTLYNRISALAQFFDYLRTEVGLINLIPVNPARASLPKANKPYKSAVHLRDHALLRFFVATGRRRAEIINLRGKNIEIKKGRFFIKAKVKGGFFLNFELDNETTQNALFEYLEATERTDIFGRDEPLWLKSCLKTRKIAEN